jgi:segregation and condensation protein B
MIEPFDPMPSLSISACVEALLFVAPGPVAVGQIAAALDLSVDTVETALKQLEQQYQGSEAPRGLRIQRHHGRVQLTTAGEYAQYIERFLGLEATPSQPSCVRSFVNHSISRAGNTTSYRRIRGVTATL